MTVYETIFIMKPSLTDDEVSGVAGKIRGVIEKHGGQILKTENWGKKKLAYEVRKEKKGAYVFVRFRGPGAVVSELERQYRVEDAVIKFLTIKCDPKLLAEELAREAASAHAVAGSAAAAVSPAAAPAAGSA